MEYTDTAARDGLDDLDEDPGPLDGDALVGAAPYARVPPLSVVRRVAVRVTSPTAPAVAASDDDGDWAAETVVF